MNRIFGTALIHFQPYHLFQRKKCHFLARTRLDNTLRRFYLLYTDALAHLSLYALYKFTLTLALTFCAVILHVCFVFADTITLRNAHQRLLIDVITALSLGLIDISP